MKISPSLLFSEINEVRLSFQFKTLVLPIHHLVYHFILHICVAVYPFVSLLRLVYWTLCPPKTFAGPASGASSAERVPEFVTETRGK